MLLFPFSRCKVIQVVFDMCLVLVSKYILVRRVLDLFDELLLLFEEGNLLLELLLEQVSPFSLFLDQVLQLPPLLLLPNLFL